MCVSKTAATAPKKFRPCMNLQEKEGTTVLIDFKINPYRNICQNWIFQPDLVAYQLCLIDVRLVWNNSVRNQRLLR